MTWFWASLAASMAWLTSAVDLGRHALLEVVEQVFDTGFEGAEALLDQLELVVDPAGHGLELDLGVVGVRARAAAQLTAADLGLLEGDHAEADGDVEGVLEDAR